MQRAKCIPEEKVRKKLDLMFVMPFLVDVLLTEKNPQSFKFYIVYMVWKNGISVIFMEIEFKIWKLIFF